MIRTAGILGSARSSIDGMEASRVSTGCFISVTIHVRGPRRDRLRHVFRDEVYGIGCRSEAWLPPVRRTREHTGACVEPSEGALL